MCVCVCVCVRVRAHVRVCGLILFVSLPEGSFDCNLVANVLEMSSGGVGLGSVTLQNGPASCRPMGQ